MACLLIVNTEVIFLDVMILADFGMTTFTFQCFRKILYALLVCTVFSSVAPDSVTSLIKYLIVSCPLDAVSYYSWTALL